MPAQHPQQRSGVVRVAYLTVGWLCFALGMLGVVLPVLPTTPFLLLALWAFSRSSLRLHRWLYRQRTFGPALQRWHQHRIIPLHAKLLIALTMSASLVYLTGFSRLPMLIIWAVALIMLTVATYLLSRPSRLKGEKQRTE
ncbi:YbaN family protein [Sedimenticola hydrogenitrophicus]|uniref:YbaN family protein n=1 Tax=Sedimenticola hydrogenitrophicus TaxID=2967975 RepID=UPI0021A70382|nr:YbaN family protein [Sedimenticola hydrogenitrophicus]